jgi:hypothetical protein
MNEQLLGRGRRATHMLDQIGLDRAKISPLLGAAVDRCANHAAA